MKNNIAWVFELTLKEGKLEELKKVMAKLSEIAEKEEEGTLNYEWTLSQDGKKCHVYERYIDSEAAVLHLNKLIANNVDKVMALGDITYFIVYGNPSEECRKILDGLGAVYMEFIGGFSR